MAGDFNVSQTKQDIHPRLRTAEPHTRARAELASLLVETEMVDAFRHLHPEERRYTWFNRRAWAGRLDAARVDYVLVSSELMNDVRSATILDDPELRPGSDHAPIAIEVNWP